MTGQGLLERKFIFGVEKAPVDAGIGGNPEIGSEAAVDASPGSFGGKQKSSGFVEKIGDGRKGAEPGKG
jgi:hypothetical protein